MYFLLSNTVSKEIAISIMDNNKLSRRLTLFGKFVGRLCLDYSFLLFFIFVLAMSEGIKYAEPKDPTPQNMRPGFCSATCTDKASLQEEIKKAEPKTSDFFATCNLPKRFKHPHWFNGYGCQVSKQHPFYRTSASVYGWYPPGIHSVPSVFYPAGQTFTNRLAEAGMYRNYSLNTGMDPVGYS